MRRGFERSWKTGVVGASERLVWVSGCLCVSGVRAAPVRVI